MPGNPRSGSKACDSSRKTRPVFGRKAAITCAATPGRTAMASGFVGNDAGSADLLSAGASEACVKFDVMKQPVRAAALNAGKMPALPVPKDAAAVILLRHNTNP